MKKKSLLSTLLIAGLLAVPTSAMANTYFDDNGMPSVETPKDVTLHLDGRYIYTDVDPVIQNGRTMFPLRAAGEALEAEVVWDQASQTATATKNGNTVIFTLNNKTYYINGEAHTADVAPALVNNRTMLPIRAFGEAFGVTVDWDQALYDVTIDTDKKDIQPNIPAGASLDEQTYITKYYVPSDPSDPYVGSWHKTETSYNPGYPNAGVPAETSVIDDYFFVSKVGNNYNVAQIHIVDSSLRNFDSITVMKDDSSIVTTGDETNTYVVDYDQQISYYRGPIIGWTLSYLHYYDLHLDSDQLELINIVERPSNLPMHQNNSVPYDRF